MLAEFFRSMHVRNSFAHTLSSNAFAEHAPVLQAQCKQRQRQPRLALVRHSPRTRASAEPEHEIRKAPGSVLMFMFQVPVSTCVRAFTERLLPKQRLSPETVCGKGLRC